MYDGSKSDESGSTSRRAGENGLDRAASKGGRRASPRGTRGSSSTKPPGRPACDVRRVRLETKSVARAELVEHGLAGCLHGIASDVGRDDGAAPALPSTAADVDVGGPDGQGRRRRRRSCPGPEGAWWLFQVSCDFVRISLLDLRVRKGCSAAAVAWRRARPGAVRRQLPAYFGRDRPRGGGGGVDRGSDDAITKSSKIKTNESPSSPSESLGSSGAWSGYVMTDSNIRTAVAAWLADATAAEATYGHISTWATGG